jgi:hypothetical protein
MVSLGWPSSPVVVDAVLDEVGAAVDVVLAGGFPPHPVSIDDAVRIAVSINAVSFLLFIM